MIDSTFDPITGGLIFRHVCETCGLLSSWATSPEQTVADRPASCRAHDDGGDAA